MKNYLKILGPYAISKQGNYIQTFENDTSKVLDYMIKVGFKQFFHEREIIYEKTYRALIWVYYFVYFDQNINKAFNNFKKEFDTLDLNTKKIVKDTIYGDVSLTIVDDNSYINLMNYSFVIVFIKDVYDEINFNNYKKFLVKCMLLEFSDEPILFNNLINMSLTAKQQLFVLNKRLIEIISRDHYKVMIELLCKFNNVKILPSIQKIIKDFIFSLFSQDGHHLTEQIELLKILVPRLTFTNEERKNLMRLESKKLLLMV